MVNEEMTLNSRVNKLEKKVEHLESLHQDTLMTIGNFVILFTKLSKKLSEKVEVTQA